MLAICVRPPTSPLILDLQRASSQPSLNSRIQDMTEGRGKEEEAQAQGKSKKGDVPSDRSVRRQDSSTLHAAHPRRAKVCHPERHELAIGANLM